MAGFRVKFALNQCSTAQYYCSVLYMVNSPIRYIAHRACFEQAWYCEEVVTYLKGNDRSLYEPCL